MCSKAIIFLIFTTSSIYLTTVSAVLRLEDEYFMGVEASRFNWTKHKCRRDCGDDTTEETCEYVFVIERYETMSKACYDCPFNNTDCSRPHCIAADGFAKPIYTVNRQIPGPLVEVCKNDIIKVEVRNLMKSESITIHWHGFKQFESPYMDGVPFVTQCPILPGESFTYAFIASSTGTFFYHSHIGSQRADGLFGPMIVKDRTSQNLYRDEFDYDVHRMVINEWTHNTGENDELHDNHVSFESRPKSILINGHGQYEMFSRKGATTQTGRALFEVRPHQNYRIRTINAGSVNCPIMLSIDDHELHVIALDSKYIRPVTVDAITTWPGERYDFILNTTRRAGNYWIRVKGLSRCQNTTTEGAYGTAILRYTNTKLKDPKKAIGYEYPIITPTFRILNPYDAVFDEDQKVNISIANLTSTDVDDLTRTQIQPNQTVYISFDTYPVNNYEYHRKNLYGFYDVAPNHRLSTPQLNHISLHLPPKPLLSQHDELDPNTFCNSSYNPMKLDCKTEFCACPHVINVQWMSVVEIILVEEGRYTAINHPFHLHGHFITVMAEKRLKGTVSIEQVKALDKAGKIKRNFNRPVIKDTMKSPSSGYTIIRFLANNPGYWLFHCHFDPHSNIGMALVFKVGEHDMFVEKPTNFPTCGTYPYDGF